MKPCAVPARFTSVAIDRLIQALSEIREQCLGMERRFEREIEKVEPELRISARNLLHYLALRQHDLREIQRELSLYGLSSLGRMEAHTLAGLDAVLAVLHKLAGRPMARAPEYVPQVDFATGPAILNNHTEDLLGPPPHDRMVRIMVTMPSEAATDYALVRDLLKAGMDLMRINCAHDDPHAWRGMIENLHRAKQEVGRRCRVLMDLAGPKLRTTATSDVKHVVRWKPRRDLLGRVIAPAVVWVTGEGNVAPPAESVKLPITDDLIPLVREGSVLRLKDCRGKPRELKIVRIEKAGARAESVQSAYVMHGTPIEV